MYSCKIHKSFRMPNCIIFPVDLRDIEDRNLVSSEPCGYKFVSAIKTADTNAISGIETPLIVGTSAIKTAPANPIDVSEKK